MKLTVHFYSYFKELTGCSETTIEVPGGCTLEAAFARVSEVFPRLAPVGKSTLMAVGVDYQARKYVLREGEELSLFPPVQGG